MKAGVMICMPLEPSAEGSSGDGEGDIRHVCNDGNGISVGRLHGRGHVLRGLMGPLWIMKVVIASQVAVANVASLYRACWVRPVRGAMACLWPVVAVCPSRRRPRSPVGIPPRGFRHGVGQVLLGELEERRGYAHAWV